MKSILISLLIITGVQAKAQENLGVMATKGGAPIFANLTLNNLTRNMSAINPFISFNNFTRITFNSKQVVLSVELPMPECPINAYCIQSMPAPIETTLEVVKVEQTGCSIVYTARTPANVRSKIYEQVVIEDFSFSLCEMVYISPGHLNYKVTGLSQLTKRTESATAMFSIPEFVRAVN